MELRKSAPECLYFEDDQSETRLFMNLGWKLLLAALVLGILLPFTVLKDDAGSTLLKFSELKWPDWGKAIENLPKPNDPSSLSGEDESTIYQWIDAEGNQQFSNSQPPEGVEYKVKIYDSNLNVIQSVDGIKDEQESTLSPEDNSPDGDQLDSPYSTEGIEKLFEKTKEVEKLIKQRFQNQEAILGQ